MGRNGKNPPVFKAMIQFINDNVGKTVSSAEILQGNLPGRNSATSYLYTFVKLGYVKPTNGSFVNSPASAFEILKPFPKGYTSVTYKAEVRAFNGLIP